MMTLFGGFHRVFAPLRTKEAITSDGKPLEPDAELSRSSEAGIRLQRSRLLQGIQRGVFREMNGELKFAF